MELGNRHYFEVDTLLQKYGAPRSNWTPRLRQGKQGAKWQDQKGPNPLVLKGLDRS
ncbi:MULTISPECIES: hypothetical protein [Stappiaceae]|uniref:hypothetical protein n=1 Tax=Stappiaceae TaxID=2821832 RepID=UPI0012FD478C|nr:hypothetical protein [Labrenzia sp. VG12]